MPSLQLSENTFLFEPLSLWLLQDIKHMNTLHEFKELSFSKNLSGTSYLSECQIDPVFITYAEMWRIAVDGRCPLLLLSALVFWDRFSRTSQIQLHRLTSKPYRLSCLYLPSSPIARTSYLPWLFCEFWGAELRSPCLCSMLFSWAINPAPFHTIWFKS